MGRDIRRSIEQELDRIEQEESVQICLAVESGSRAWGFASEDSDYDVRFIYAHRPEWYLSIDLEERPDTLQRPLSESLDFSGWDVRKALKLFRKSNPPLLEWLQSPTVYRETGALADQLRARLRTFYSPKACAFHYWHMAEGNMREYLNGEHVWRKKYLYVLRPLLATRWIAQGRGPIPIEFSRLVEVTVDKPGVRRAIDDLVAAKRSGAELDRGPRVSALSDFIETEMAQVEQRLGAASTLNPVSDDLDTVFRDVIGEPWASR